jgi:EpsI family protein
VSVSTTRRACLGFAAMAFFALTAAALTPTRLLADARPHRIALAEALPRAFGHWHDDPAAMGGLIVNPQQEEVLQRIYSQQLTRTYVSDRGERVMVALAYGADQSKREGLQLHYPEVCYPAQGFEVRSGRSGAIEFPGGRLPVRRLETVFSEQRYEPVTYWTMTGDEATLGGWHKKAVEFRYSLRGEITDGLLFRVSSIGRESDAEFALQERFVRELVAALQPEDRLALTGLH